MDQKSSQPSITSSPSIHWMGALWSMWKKNIDQVKLLWDSWKFWGTEVHSNLLPEFNLPATEMIFSEAPVGYHESWKNNKDNS